jgi:hypothetical protein
VLDRVLGGGDEQHVVKVRFPLAPGLRAKLTGPQVVEVQRAGALVLTLSSNVAWSVEGSWYSPAYGVRVERATVVGTWRGALPAEITTSLAM